MSTKIQFPNTRLTQAALGNPLFVTDVENLTSNLLEAINMLLGLPTSGATAFAILSGFEYDSEGASYSTGIVYMNGLIYYCATGLAETKYLAPAPTDGNSKVFSDGNSYNTYRIYYAVSSNSQVGGMPQFNGTMDQYRLSLTAMKGDTIEKVPVIGTDLVASLPVFTDTNKKLLTKSVADTLTALGTDTTNDPREIKTDAGITLHTKRLVTDIWDMDTNATSTVAHGIADFKKIQTILAWIRNDAETLRVSLTGDNVGSITWDATNVNLTRKTSGVCDSADFSGTSVPRGYLVITYLT